MIAAAAPPAPPAAAAPAAAPARGRPGEADVTVVAARGPTPQLVRSHPAAGTTAPFGVLVLTLAFDQPMDAASAPGAPSGADAPACLPDWRLLADRRTFVLLCSLKAGTAYRVRLPAPGAGAFRSTGARPAEPLDLAFSTDADKTDPDLGEALRSAGLTAKDGPVMDWRGPRTPPTDMAASPQSR